MTIQPKSALSPLPRLTLAAVLAAVPAVALGQSAIAAGAEDPSRVMTAVRVAAPPRIDGRDDDAAWSSVPALRGFRMFTPHEGRAPTMATEARIAYDDRALYVLVRAFDPHPDSIVRRLARRDTDDPTADQIRLFVDSYHDRRTGFEFGATAAGVKSDALMFDDTGEDDSWDGVWDVATHIDSLGWIAEFAVPLRQLRFTDREHPTFGFTIARFIGRTGERASLPQYRRSVAGRASQLGTLVGLRDLARPAALELVPYALTRTENGTPLAGVPTSLRTTPAAGLDAKWLPRPDVSVDVTVNPDFGQVEADPAVLDLSGVEVFQAERRPFFLEGGGLLTLPLATEGAGELFYSRRIGRAPTLGRELGGAYAPAATTILGAGKVTAHLGTATSFAGLGAVTSDEWGADRPDGSGRFLVEPRARYGVARLQRDARGGRSGIGVMATAMSRDTRDSLTSATLLSSARTGAITTQHQTRDGAYQVSGWLAGSDVEGDARAVAGTQLSTVHAFQRPDDGVAFDSTRTRLGGGAGELFAGKVGGGVTRFDASYRAISPGFEVNELGYLTVAGTRTASAHVGLKSRRPGRVLGAPYRSASTSLRFTGDWSTSGLPYARGLVLENSFELPSQSKIGLRLQGYLPGAYCTVACTRGGPAIVNEPARIAVLDLTGDERRQVVPHASLQLARDDGGRSRLASGQLEATWRVRSNFDVQAAAFAEAMVDAAQFFRRFGDPASDTARYTVARLAQDTRSLTLRVNYTFTRALTMQWYAQAYISRGEYSDVREIADGRSPDWDRRFRPSTDPAAAEPGGIDFKQLRSNAVLRWEYRPGSTLFVVWTQGRDVDAGEAGSLALWPGRDLGDLFRRAPSNTVAVKATYWLGR